MHEAGDVLHSVKVRNRMSGAQGSFTGNVFSKTWGWTKNVATNKELSLIQRAGGAAVGTALSGAALTAKGLFGLVRGGLKGAADAVSDAYTNR